MICFTHWSIHSHFCLCQWWRGMGNWCLFQRCEYNSHHNPIYTQNTQNSSPDIKIKVCSKRNSWIAHQKIRHQYFTFNWGLHWFRQIHWETYGVVEGWWELVLVQVRWWDWRRSEVIRIFTTISLWSEHTLQWESLRWLKCDGCPSTGTVS